MTSFFSSMLTWNATKLTSLPHSSESNSLNTSSAPAKLPCPSVVPTTKKEIKVQLLWSSICL
jgi:hypothetical protein